MKKIVFILQALLLVSPALVSAQLYDFSACAPTGQRLYYKISSTGASAVSPNPGSSWVRGNLVIPDSVEHDDTTYLVTQIGEDAFWGCYYLESVTVPITVVSIAKCAFEDCYGLSTFTFHNSVRSIGAWAFMESGITRVNFRGTFADWCKIDFADNASNPIGGGAALYINDTLLKDAVFPDSARIGKYVLYGYRYLAGIELPRHILEWDYTAFQYCSNVTAIYSHCTAPTTMWRYGFAGFRSDLYVAIPCGTAEAYDSIGLYFSNVAEVFDYEISATANDVRAGSVRVSGRPTCSNPFVEMKAVSKSGYHFERWNDGSTCNPRSVEMTSDTAFVAIFEMDRTAGITTADDAASVRVYPNPCVDGFVIEGEDAGSATLYDLRGTARIRDIRPHEFVSTTGLPRGTYLLQIAGRPAQKLMVAK